jgi:ribosomal protein S18 acetylase RimI-like enzyme
MEKNEFIFRKGVTYNDLPWLRSILESSGFFFDFEIDVAIDLAEEFIETGENSGYMFIVAELDGIPVGYTCYGEIACTKGSFDLYWIAVHEKTRSKGLGKKLIDQTIQDIRLKNGRCVYIETSSKEKYIPTQKFYNSCGCSIVARIPDFYDIGDDKLIYSLKIESGNLKSSPE